MRQIGLGLGSRRDGIVTRHPTLTQAGQLGKDKPDPVAFFTTATELGQDLVKNGALRIDKAFEVESVSQSVPSSENWYSGNRSSGSGDRGISKPGENLAAGRVRQRAEDCSLIECPRGIIIPEGEFLKMADNQASNQLAAGRPGIQRARSGGRTGLQDSQISQIVVINKDTGEQRVVIKTDQLVEAPKTTASPRTVARSTRAPRATCMPSRSKAGPLGA